MKTDPVVMKVLHDRITYCNIHQYQRVTDELTMTNEKVRNYADTETTLAGGGNHCVNIV